MVNLIIYTFFILSGFALLYNFAGKKNFESLVKINGVEEAEKKCKHGKLGGVFMILLGFIGYVSVFI